MMRPAAAQPSASALTLRASVRSQVAWLHVQKRFAGAVAGIVDQHVEPAEQRGAVIDRLFGIFDQIDRKRVPAAGLGDRLGAGPVDIGHHDFRAALSGAERDRASEPARPAGHQKPHASSPPSLVVSSAPMKSNLRLSRKAGGR